MRKGSKEGEVEKAKWRRGRGGSGERRERVIRSAKYDT